MVKVDFDLDKLLGDILSPDGLYVDLISCNEYTVWYLMRQAGLKGYLPVLRTKAFLTEKPFSHVSAFGLYQDTNLQIIMANLLKFYGVGIVQYDKNNDSLEEFIKEGISKEQFVYVLYDYYYDTLYTQDRVHDYHGHPITGYDDEKQIYSSLVRGVHDIKVNDLQKMLKHCYELFGTSKNHYFYLEGHIKNEQLIPWTETIVDEIRCDCRRIINDWLMEVDIFKDYCYQILKILTSSVEERRDYALKQRLIFNSMAEGMHGNFIFRLRLIHDTLGVNTNDMEQRFLSNRKKGIMIANMYRKASVLIDDDEDMYAETIYHIKEKVQELFVDESIDLLVEFQNLTEKEGLK